MTGEGGVSARYVAFSLALELGRQDVDAMLESMTAMQYREWLAFFQIRAEREKGPQGGYGIGPEEQRRMSGDIVRAMTGYQGRREAWKK
ncbi:MAG: phage tail assembly protein T [Deltaproteobacteria bacterium]|jgi:hypothetical protein|nr:phage tail assembly protein T [Deltaproteobacteria bacterium]